MQKTLEKSITIKGTGLHSGCEVTLTLNPAPENTGIVFKRTDLPLQPEIKALYSNIVDTRNCSCLGDGKGNLVSTIEHLMGALYIKGIDNALIEVDNQELPIMDGSALPFYEILSQAELQEQNAKRKYLRVKKTIKFEDGKGGSVVLEPSEDFAIHFEIEFHTFLIRHIIHSHVPVYAKVSCRLHRINVGTKENKLPAIAFLLPLDHLLNPC